MSYLPTLNIGPDWQIVTFTGIEEAEGKHGYFYWVKVEKKGLLDSTEALRFALSPTQYRGQTAEWGSSEWSNVQPGTKIAVRKVGTGMKSHTEWFPLADTPPQLKHSLGL